MQLFIKNMVCDRCILVVRQELDKMSLSADSILLGEVRLSKEPAGGQLEQLKINLAAQGFEILDDSRKKLIEKIKNLVIGHVHHSASDEHQNFSDILSASLHKDYSYLSGFFSDVEGITIEKFIINQKIEKVKELIVYNEMNLSEIADQLGYSSVAYLSAQFKKVTGLTPSHFKKVGRDKRTPLDKV